MDFGGKSTQTVSWLSWVTLGTELTLQVSASLSLGLRQSTALHCEPLDKCLISASSYFSILSPPFFSLLLHSSPSGNEASVNSSVPIPFQVAKELRPHGRELARSHGPWGRPVFLQLWVCD